MKTLLLVLVMMINFQVEAQISYWIPAASIVIDNSNTSIQIPVPPQTPATTPILFCRKNSTSANTLVFLTTINNSGASYPDINGVAQYLDRLVLRCRMSSSNSTGWGAWNDLESNGPTNTAAFNFTQLSIPNDYHLTINLDNLPNMFDKQYSGRIEFELITRSSINTLLIGIPSHYFSLEVTPPAPIYNGFTTTASCPVPSGQLTGTGSVTIRDITAYQEARLWLTTEQIPTAPGPSSTTCNAGSLDYPACLYLTSTQQILLNETLGGTSAPLFISSVTYPNLASGTYYLHIINRGVSEPLKCSTFNYPITIDTVPTLQTPLISVSPLVTTIPLLNSPPDWFTSNISNNSVVVDNANDVFISDFKGHCCPNSAPSEQGIIRINGKGGNAPFSLSVEKASFSMATNFVSYTTNTTLLSTNVIHSTPALPLFRWSGEINNLSEGIYRLTVTDACGKSVVNTVVIKKPIAIEAVNTTPISVIQPICSTDLGIATLSVKAEKKPENFAETSVNTQWRVYKIINGVETPISVDYRLNGGTTANGQTGTTEISTTAGSTLDFSMSNLQAGNYVVYMDRGQYVWTNPSLLQCNLAGSFPCTGAPFPFTINAVTPLSVPITGVGAPFATIITCPTGTNTLIPTTPDANSDGIITMTASGTTVGGLYIYELLKETTPNDYAPVAGQVQTSVFANFIGLSAGNYKIVTKRNITGCTSDDITSNVIIVSEPPPLVVNSVIQNISCFGATVDGSITVTISGGTPFTTPAPATPYQLTLSSGPVTLSNVPVRNGNQYTYSNLPQGDYRLAIKDGNQCSRFLTNNANNIDFSIIEPLQLTVTGLTINNIICSTDIAHIVPTVAVGTGTAPYRFFYQIGTATPVEYVATDAFATGTYTISVKDSRGCIAVFAGTVANTVTINSATTPIVAPITLSSFSGGYQISCLNGNNGEITINSVTGGNGVGFANTYQYKINKTSPIVVNGTYQNSTVAGSNVFADLTKGEYDIYVKDSRGCETIQSVTLTEPNIVIGYNVGLIENVLCANEATGKITITPTGGSGIGYQVAIRKQGLTTALIYVPVTGATYTFGALPGTGLRADTYEIYVEDNNGCTSSLQTQMVTSAFPQVTVTAVQNNISCLGGIPDGSLTITPTAGLAPFVYNWIGGRNTTNTRTGLSAGIYQLEITDTNGCTELFTFTITQPALALSATATTDVACYQQTNGKITLTTLGGTPPYQYSKDNGTNWLAGSSTYIFNNLAPQVYNLKVKDSKNCIVAFSKTVTERGDTPKIAYLVSTRQNAEDEIVLVNVSVPEPTSTLWEFDANTTVIRQANDKAVVRYNAPGSFPVKMIANFTDCIYTSTKNISISPLDTPIPGVTPGTRPIASAIVTPNPNDGNFNLVLTLNKRQYVHLILVDAMGNIRYEDKNTTTRFLSVNKNISVDIPNGVYNLRIITDDDAKDIRITVVK